MKKRILILIMVMVGVVCSAQVKIEDLTRATTATKTDLLIIDQSDDTKGIAIQHLFSGDSLFLPDLATSETKVLSPTSTGGTTSLETADGTSITWSALDADTVEVNHQMRAATSIWYYASSACAINLSPGGSGAILTVPDANTLGGYQFNAAGEKLYIAKSVTSLWDGASDLEVKVTWEVNEASAADGTVDLQLVCYYKGDHESVNKTQTLEEAHTITGNKARYTRHTTTFTINWDETDNVVEVADKISFILNLETDTSECDDIIINVIMFKYKTKKVRIEV